MRLDVPRQTSVTLRRWFAFGCVAAFLMTLALSAAPRLHDQLHSAQGAEHSCAVTLIASGGCDHFTQATPSGLPAKNAAATSVRPSEAGKAVAPVTSSILEHAPPRLA